MCLIVFAYRCHPQYRMVLAANRDEFFARPTQAMGYWHDQPALLAGRDLEQGGTWLGLNKNGRFSALTNHRNGRLPATGTRSRGFLPTDFLLSNSSAESFSHIVEMEQYDGFNQIVMDNHSLWYLSNRAQAEALTPGIYGISNAVLNSPWPKLSSRRSGLKQLIQTEQLSCDNLIALMADPTVYPDNQLPDTGISQEWERALSASFIKMDNYGTRATTGLLIDYQGKTEIVEQSYDTEGKTRRQQFNLQLTPETEPA